MMKTDSIDSTLSKTKPTLRKQFLAKRQNFATTQTEKVRAWEEAIGSGLEEYLSSISFDSIMFYYPHAGEVSLLALLEGLWSRQSGKTVLFPKVMGKGKMIACPVSKGGDWVTGFMGIKEPKLPEEFLSSVDAIEKTFSAIDVILVPGVAFTAIPNNQDGFHLNRLGYGGGYYDWFLRGYPEARKVGIFFEFQKSEFDFVESHDMNLDVIVTERATYYA